MVPAAAVFSAVIRIRLHGDSLDKYPLNHPPIGSDGASPSAVEALGSKLSRRISPRPANGRVAATHNAGDKLAAPIGAGIPIVGRSWQVPLGVAHLAKDSRRAIVDEVEFLVEKNQAAVRPRRPGKTGVRARKGKKGTARDDRRDVLPNAAERISALPDVFVAPSGRELRVHPLAKLMPLMSVAEFERLRKSIASAKKTLVPVLVTSDDQVVDGRHRLKLCEELGIEPAITILDDTIDPIDALVGANETRRRLNDSQRAVVAARIATLGPGRPTANAQKRAVSQALAAEKLGVSRTLVQSARRLIDEGVPELVAFVERGELVVSAAVSIAELDRVEQRELVQSGLPAIRQRSREIRRRHTQKDKEAVEADREAVGDFAQRASEAELRAEHALAAGSTPKAIVFEASGSGAVVDDHTESSMKTNDRDGAGPTAASSARPSSSLPAGGLGIQADASGEWNDSAPPLRAELADPTVFDLEAWFSFELESTLRKFRAALARRPEIRQILEADGFASESYARTVGWLLNVVHPSRWRACYLCDGGRGAEDMCTFCDGRGYTYQPRD